MNFNTPVILKKPNFEIGLNQNVLSMGSCFADNIGHKYEALQLPFWSNPYGTIFNIASIFEIIQQAQKPYDSTYSLRRDELYFDYRFHTELHASSLDLLKIKIEELNQKFIDNLKNAKVFILTLGTSWVYTLGDLVVANCHKQDPKLFKKVLLSETEQYDYLKKLILTLKKLNPNLNIILTVSPVRHIKDGLPENAVSKAILRFITHKAVIEYDHVSYFPSYEILLDELRDYRYYADDLIHPSSMAVNYILEKFEENYFSEPLKENLKKRTAILNALNHRPLNPKSATHQKFLKKLEAEMEKIGWKK